MSEIKFKEREGFTPRTPIKPVFSGSGPEKPRPPDPSTSFQPGGSGARDQARREVNAEMARGARVRGLQKLAGRGDRSAAALLMDLGLDPLGGGGIQHYDDKVKQATGSYMNNAENRYDVGQVGKGGADAIEQAARPAGPLAPGGGVKPGDVSKGFMVESGYSKVDTPSPAPSATAPAATSLSPTTAPKTADPMEEDSTRMFEGSFSTPDRNESSTAARDQQANRESAMSATDAAYQRLEASRQKRIEAEKISDAALSNFETKKATREAEIVENDKMRREMIAQVAADRDVWFQDVKANVRASGIDPDTGKHGPFSNIKRAFTGVRKDAPMPQVDWNQFDSRSPGDPNFGRTRYQSQYQNVEVPTQYGSTRTEVQYKGEYVDPYQHKTPKGMRRTGIGYVPIAVDDYARESEPKSPL